MAQVIVIQVLSAGGQPVAQIENVRTGEQTLVRAKFVNGRLTFEVPAKWEEEELEN